MSFKLSGLKPHTDILKQIAGLTGDKELYLVGGAVRDLFLERKTLDLDFAVQGSGMKFASRVARKMKGAFVPLSEEEDEARVVIRKELILDFRGFKESLLKDLASRDFTINAMALPVKALLEGQDLSPIDPFEGISDLEKGIVRAVGPGSIKADPLRILRAYRFAAQLRFRIDPALEHEAEQTSLEGVARERIAYELMLILGFPRVYPLINRMIVAGLMQQIFPFDEFWADYAVRSHSLAVLGTLERMLEERRFPPLIRERIEEIAADPHRTALLKLATLFHDVSKPETKVRTDNGRMHFYGHDTKGARKMRRTLQKELRFSRADAEYTEQTIARHMHLHLIATGPQLTERAMRRFSRMCADVTSEVMALDLADGFATAGRTRHLERTIVKILKLAAEDAKRAAFVPLVNGHDLIALGLKPGPIFKVILGELEELQWERKITTKQEGLALVKEKLANGEYPPPLPPSSGNKQS
ncbi:MAG: HD domain-containing protein [Candidatus Stahlbacteria bacterium]|nr:MAG: HD domain-containing protein [Candidatus Stahlbacteria bacterium]